MNKTTTTYYSSDRKIKVLIIDDSALIRNTLRTVLSSDPKIEVIGTASDPYVAVEKIKHETPDVITLDVEMPRMDGLTFLAKLMNQYPIPVIIISTLTERSAENAIMALEYGAVEVIAKPKLGTREHFENARMELCDKVKAASLAFITRRGPFGRKNETSGNRSFQAPNQIRTSERVIAIGASTGGTEAIKSVLMQMPIDCPGIIITQHMPEMFTTQFAKRLDETCPIRVKEAENGETVLRGCALIAPGNSHMSLRRSGARYYIELSDGPPVNRHRPSVDVLFKSVARHAGKNSIGVLLTGMGSDGALGLLEMKKSEAFTIAQDEASSVIFGMPKEAIKLNAASTVLPLNEIPNLLIKQNLHTIY